MVVSAAQLASFDTMSDDDNVSSQSSLFTFDVDIDDDVDVDMEGVKQEAHVCRCKEDTSMATLKKTDPGLYRFMTRDFFIYLCAFAFLAIASSAFNVYQRTVIEELRRVNEDLRTDLEYSITDQYRLHSELRKWHEYNEKMQDDVEETMRTSGDDEPTDVLSVYEAIENLVNSIDYAMGSWKNLIINGGLITITLVSSFVLYWNVDEAHFEEEMVFEKFEDDVKVPTPTAETPKKKKKAKKMPVVEDKKVKSKTKRRSSKLLKRLYEDVYFDTYTPI